MISNQLKNISSATLDIFYPNHCELCQHDLQSDEKFICLKCMYDLPYIQNIAIQQTSLDFLFQGRAAVEHIHSLFNFQSGNQIQHILHLIKYKKKTKMAEHLGAKLAEQIQASDSYDYVVPVPLHPKKMRKRGYNQATLIAKGIAKHIKADLNEKLLKRVEHNPSQTTVTKFERWNNVRDVFRLARPKLLQNKHVLLVDDVLTTGATIEACLKQLLQVEGCKVSVATLAARV